MIHSVSNTTPTQPVAPSATNQQSGATKSKPVTAQDVVALSSAAQSALQEANETPAQTAKEAGAGDVQARRLMAEEAAKHAAEK